MKKSIGRQHAAVHGAFLRKTLGEADVDQGNALESALSTLEDLMLLSSNAEGILAALERHGTLDSEAAEDVLRKLVELGR